MNDRDAQIAALQDRLRHDQDYAAQARDALALCRQLAAERAADAADAKDAARQSVILQREYTLDDAMLDGFKTFRNGCNFRLVSHNGGESYSMEYGCYCLVNLVTGPERLLHKWIEAGNTIDGVHPETIVELLKREPCVECGGFRFQPRKAALAAAITSAGGTTDE